MQETTPLSVPPMVNGRYEIKDAPIGQGGMGVVYKAYDTVTKRYVALKTMWGDLDPAALELFEREWTVLARLSHPNIVDILDTGEFRDGGQRKPYFVMPLLPGATLDQLIKKHSQRLTVERTVEIICQACRGLQAAHEKGLVHRDLKPSNIFVMEDDAVKIIDFGVVHLADTRSVTGIKGTLQYMAPEQLEMKPATPLSDIFSLAVVCYETLTGRKPFHRQTDGDTVESIRTHIPPPASEINPSVNQMISRTVHKAMAKQPWHRFSAAREFADTLQKAYRNEPIERFERGKIQPRIERIKKAYSEGDHQFAMEILTELESEGHIDPDMSVLRIQIEQGMRQKTIRQLLESARTRMDEEEYPLALQKLAEALTIDPNNVDAQSLKSQIERQRSDKQIDNWFRLVKEHCDNQLFSQARQGLQEILKLDSANTEARRMLADIDQAENEATKLREEKQRLYQSALASYENGEISTALSKLERVLELTRRTSKSSTPDLDAQYQSFYNHIRSEQDAARNAYAEGRKHLLDGNAAKTLEICDQHLHKHPGDPMFQALKLEAEELQRQEQSAAIAEVDRRAEAEADLDKKYNIVKEAVEKFPNEPHFKSSLKLIRDRRDLVNSIVGRARQYEERGQYNDAAGQWDILRNIYPLYPGLNFEAERLARRREEQMHSETKARWMERVDSHFGAGNYAEAKAAIAQALVEFPQDKELQGLDSLANQGIKRSAEANLLVKSGQQLCLAQNYNEGLDALRKAERLDPRNTTARATLIGMLIQCARERMAQDWRAAEPLVKEALERDSGDPIARSLSLLIEDYRRQDEIGQLLVEARNLQASGDIPAAMQRVERGLAAYPSEVRLSQLHNTLRGAPPSIAVPSPPFATVVHEPPPPTTITPAPPMPVPPVPIGPVEVSPQSKRPTWIIAAGLAAAGIIGFAFLYSALHRPKQAIPYAAANPVAVQPNAHAAASANFSSPSPPASSEFPIDSASKTGAGNPIPVTVLANVPDATVVVDDTPLKRPMKDGTRILSLNAGSHRIKIVRDGFQDAPEQKIVLKGGDSAARLTFVLNPVLRYASVTITSAPPDAAFYVDEVQAGTVTAAGTLTRDQILPGVHTLSLRKPGFDEFKLTREFKVGDTLRIDADGMKQLGSLSVRISPGTARVSVRREGDSASSVIPNGQAVPLRPGPYTVTAEAEKFASRSEALQIEPGKTSSLDWTLAAAAGTEALRRPAPALYFENAPSWKMEPNGWWVHEAQGYSFVRAIQGTYTFDILKESQKGVFGKTKIRKIVFVTDYKGEANRVVYTLDQHNLTRKAFIGNTPQTEVKKPHGMDDGSSFRLLVEMSPEGITIKNRSGEVLDTVKHNGAPGKFGFADDVTLVISKTN